MTAPTIDVPQNPRIAHLYLSDIEAVARELNIGAGDLMAALSHVPDVAAGSSETIFEAEVHNPHQGVLRTVDGNVQGGTTHQIYVDTNVLPDVQAPNAFVLLDEELMSPAIARELAEALIVAASRAVEWLEAQA